MIIVTVTIEQRRQKTYNFTVTDTDNEQFAAEVVREQFKRTHPDWEITDIKTEVHP